MGLFYYSHRSSGQGALAVKVLPDGRNAQLIQEDFRFWLPKLWTRFDIKKLCHPEGGFYVTIGAMNA